MQFASGVPINLRSNPGEINNDGIGADRPSNVPRNSLNLPARYNVDLRLSRQFPLGGYAQGRGDRRGEEPVQHRAVERRCRTPNLAVVPATGEAIAPLPTSGDQLTPSAGYEQRQLQIGFRFVF